MVRLFFDTSVLISAFLSEHPAHDRSFARLAATQQPDITGIISNHSLAEIYSVITGIPRQPRISPAAACKILLVDLQGFEKIRLDFSDYEQTLRRMERLRLPGGGIYDALLAQAALKSNADCLLTLNPKDFTRLGDDIQRLVTAP